jgi:hypothetical protein
VFYAAVGVLIIGLASLATLTGGDLGKMRALLGSHTFLIFVAQSALGIVFGFLSSVAFATVESTEARDALQLIRAAGPDDLIDDVLALLSTEQRIMYDYHVEHTLSRRPSGMLMLNVRYRYKKLLHGSVLTFEVSRLKTDAQVEAFNASQGRIDANYQKNELFYYTFENELVESYGIEEVDAAFEMKYVLIAGGRVALTEDPLVPNKWIYSIPPGTDLNKPLEIEYEFTTACEDSDVRFIEINFPTHGVEISFNRDSGIRTEIKADAFEFLTGAETNAYVASDEGSGRHRIQHNGWLVPKCGAGFYWYSAGEDE